MHMQSSLTTDCTKLEVNKFCNAGIPFSDVNLRTHNVHQPPWTQYSSLSEVSSLSLEFTYLARAAGAHLSCLSTSPLLPACLPRSVDNAIIAANSSSHMGPTTEHLSGLWYACKSPCQRGREHVKKSLSEKTEHVLEQHFPTKHTSLPAHQTVHAQGNLFSYL